MIILIPIEIGLREIESKTLLSFFSQKNVKQKSIYLTKGLCSKK